MIISHRGELDMFAMGMVLIWIVLVMRDGGNISSLPDEDKLGYQLADAFFHRRRVSLVKRYTIRH